MSSLYRHRRFCVLNSYGVRLIHCNCRSQARITFTEVWIIFAIVSRVQLLKIYTGRVSLGVDNQLSTYYRSDVSSHRRMYLLSFKPNQKLSGGET